MVYWIVSLDHSTAPLPDGFPNGSQWIAGLADRMMDRTPDLLADRSLLPLIHGFPDSLHTVTLVKWHVGSFVCSIISSDHRWIYQHLACCSAGRIARRIAHYLHTITAFPSVGAPNHSSDITSAPSWVYSLCMALLSFHTVGGVSHLCPKAGGGSKSGGGQYLWER